MSKKSTKTKKVSNPVGRPSDYSEEKANLICEIISTTTLGLPKICESRNDLPHHDTVRVWRLQYPEFSVKYARAKLTQADLLAEECLDIADNSTSETHNICRLRIDTRKWLASKLLPKQYGDSTLLEQKNEENAQLKSELLALRAELDEKNKKPF